MSPITSDSKEASGDGGGENALPATSVGDGKRSWQQDTAFCRRCAVTFLFLYVCTFNSLSSNPKGAMELLIHQREEIYDQTINHTELAELRKVHLHDMAVPLARPFLAVPPSTWCVDGRLKQEQGPREPMGLCYVKMPRAASSTLTSVNMRMAKNFAKRHNLETCIRHDGAVPGMYYSRRDAMSFLWTFLRRPEDRALSTASKSLTKILGRRSTTDLGNYTGWTLKHLTHSDDIKDGILSEGRGGFQLQYGMLNIIPAYSAWNETQPYQIQNPSDLTRHIRIFIERYNFVGIVERMDESLVALQLLLGLETSDIMYFSTVLHEQYQRKPVRANKGKFFCQQPINPQLLHSPQVDAYLESSVWFAQNYGDYLLYEAASLSLDRTIVKIGVDKFSTAFRDFVALKKHANEASCKPIFPCSTDGTDQLNQSTSDCYYDAIGCGYPCLDKLVLASANNTS